MRSKVLPSPCLVLCSTSDSRRSERSMAPPGTSIDWSAFMNASVRRLTSSSFGAPTIGGKAACTSLKRSLATSGVVIAAVVYPGGGSDGSGRRERSGEHEDRAVVSVFAGGWKVNN